MMRHWTLYAPCLAAAMAAFVGCSLDLQGKLVESDDAGLGSSGSKHDAATSGGSAGSSDDSGASIGDDDDGASVVGSHDAAIDGSTGGNEAGTGPGPGAQDAATTCNFAGTWATKITVAVNWVPQGLMGVILAPGTGSIEQWIESARVQNGNVTTDTATVCGITLPDFAGTSFAGGEAYDIRFPDALFDNHDIPSFTLAGKLGNSTPNSTYTTDLTAVLVGLTMANPTTAAWPATVTTSVDSDNDGAKGVTAVTASGPVPGSKSQVYSDTPVDIYGNRARQIDIVIRQVTRLTGTATDCDHIAGSVAIPRIPDTAMGKFAIDSHVMGCSLTGGTTCSDTQTNFLDATQPVFSPVNAGATFTSIRLAKPIACAAVRQMLP